MRLIASIALLLAAPVAAEPVSPAEQTRIAAAAAALIEARYVDPERGKAISAALRRAKWKTSLDADAFARSVTSLLRDVSRDGHLGLSYSPTPLSEDDGSAEYSGMEMTKYYGPQVNHGVEKVERLPDNIMLLDLRVFPPSDMAGDVISAAMTLVAQGDALIIDLRRNGGGVDTGNIIAGSLVAGGSPLSGSYDRPTNTTTHSVSPSWLPGRRFGPSKPVYILTSRKTFSAAEALAYDLQALKRAVIVGEVTGGGAHPFEYRRIHPHFAADLPEGRSINPITGGNWQGVGVRPDVEVPADLALSTALELARAAIIKGRSASVRDPRSLP